MMPGTGARLGWGSEFWVRSEMGSGWAIAGMVNCRARTRAVSGAMIRVKIAVA